MQFPNAVIKLITIRALAVWHIFIFFGRIKFVFYKLFIHPFLWYW